MSDTRKLAGDEHMGAYVYCAAHVGPHSTGWCTVPTEDKRPLKAKSHEDAVEEVRTLGWRIHGEVGGIDVRDATLIGEAT